MTMIKPTKPTNPEVAAARIIFILDRSGSMSSIRNDAIGGFNSYIDSQRDLPGETTVTLVQFDNQYEVHLDSVDIKNVPPLTYSTFVPRGNTALYDAVGRAIKTYRESHDPAVKTIVAIMTDGEENASREYTHDSVKQLITEVEANGWDVMFLGANMNAVAVAQTMGISASKAATYDYDGKGVGDAFASMGIATTAYRSMGAVGDIDVTKIYANVKSGSV